MCTLHCVSFEQNISGCTHDDVSENGDCWYAFQLKLPYVVSNTLFHSWRTLALSSQFHALSLMLSISLCTCDRRHHFCQMLLYVALSTASSKYFQLIINELFLNNTFNINHKHIGSLYIFLFFFRGVCYWSCGAKHFSQFVRYESENVCDVQFWYDCFKIGTISNRLKTELYFESLFVWLFFYLNNIFQTHQHYLSAF